MAEMRETSFGRMLTLAWGGDPEAVELLTFQAEGRDHTHDRWEHAVCLSGPCEIIVDGEEQPAPVGAVFSVPPDTPHRMRPTTDEPSHWLLWYSDGPATLSTPREPDKVDAGVSSVFRVFSGDSWREGDLRTVVHAAQAPYRIFRPDTDPSPYTDEAYPSTTGDPIRAVTATVNRLRRLLGEEGGG